VSPVARNNATLFSFNTAMMRTDYDSSSPRIINTNGNDYDNNQGMPILKNLRKNPQTTRAMKVHKSYDFKANNIYD